LYFVSVQSHGRGISNCLATVRMDFLGERAKDCLVLHDRCFPQMFLFAQSSLYITQFLSPLSTNFLRHARIEGCATGGSLPYFFCSFANSAHQIFSVHFCGSAYSHLVLYCSWVFLNTCYLKSLHATQNNNLCIVLQRFHQLWHKSESFSSFLKPHYRQK